MPDEVKDETNPEAEYGAAGMDKPNERLRQARLAAGYDSARAAARAFGWNEETYKAHESGARGLRQPVAKRYADALRITLAWLLLGEGEGPRRGSRPEVKEPSRAEMMPLAPQPAFTPIMAPPRNHDAAHLPVYGNIVEREGGEAVDLGAISADLPAPRSLSGVKKAFGVYVVGESCAPLFKPGDLVWTNPGKPLTKGCGVVVVFTDNTAIVRVYQRRDAAIVELEQLNPPQKIKVPRDRVSGLYRIVTTDYA